MKTRSIDLSAAPESLWWAKEPFAFRIRKEYQKRMMIGFAVGVAFLLLTLAYYFIMQAISGDEDLPKMVTVKITPEAIPPPPPIEETTGDAGEGEGGGGGDEGGSGGDMSDAGSRQGVASAVAAGVQAGIAEALSSVVFGEGGGIPTATQGALGSGEGILSNIGAGGGLKGLSGSGLGTGGAGFGSGGEVGFGGAGGGIGGGKGIGLGGKGTGLGGGGRKGIGVGSRMGSLTVRANMRNMKIGGSSGRTADEISRVVNSNSAAILDCYSQAKATNASLSGGMVVVSLVIRPDGGVATTRVVNSTLKDPRLEQCIQTKMRRFRFSAVSVQEMQKVDIPYDFSDQ
ncbi:MAG: TonB family protein [Chlorobiales bacterium]|nr:TonB family protein [Chlorobiales bacterium]